MAEEGRKEGRKEGKEKEEKGRIRKRREGEEGGSSSFLKPTRDEFQSSNQHLRNGVFDAQIRLSFIVTEGEKKLMLQ